MQCIERSGEVERAVAGRSDHQHQHHQEAANLCACGRCCKRFSGQGQLPGTRSTRCPGDPLRKILNSFTGPVGVDLDVRCRIFPRFCETEKCKLIVSLTGRSQIDNERLFQIVIAAFYCSVVP